VSKIEQAITDRTKAIIPVHLYGQPADMDPILEIARQRGLAVIEDACQAHGARYKGKRVGSLGHAAAFSFYPAKNLGAYGDGGMVVTDNERVVEVVRMYRNYGQRAKYDHVVRGYNHRLDALQAAVLRVKLEHLAGWNAARREYAQQYNSLLAQCPVALPVEADYAESVYHLYVIRVKNRDELRGHLLDQGIATGVHYPTPIHLQPAYKELGYRSGDFPVSERYMTRLLSLPMYPELEPELIYRVTQAIECFMNQHSVESVPELLAYAG
jgi:dTDP-4-amino-4,6-dideoxygalactose transaminase